MSQEKYVIVDIHPMDAFYDQKDILAGKVVFIRDDELDYDYLTEKISREYGSGYLILEENINGKFSKNDFLYFLAVQVAPLSEIKNK